MSEEVMDFINDLKMSMEEEDKDLHKYDNYADRAKDLKLYSLQGILRDIAQEEKTHRNILHHFINKVETE